MRKLKPKYKWSKRESHFVDLRMQRNMLQAMRNSLEATLNLYMKYDLNKEFRLAGINEFIPKSQWTEEEVKELTDAGLQLKPENEHFKLTSAHLADESALE